MEVERKNQGERYEKDNERKRETQKWERRLRVGGKKIERGSSQEM